MALQGEYLGMPVALSELDQDNLAFYRYCGAGELRLQTCSECGFKRYPPTSACPFCACPDASWEPLAGLGTVYSYGLVHHAIQPAFRPFTPYLLLLVELDEQRDVPAAFDGLRMTGNLVTPAGHLAPADQVERVGIGSRLRVVFCSIGEGIALPQWTIDEQAEQPEPAWRYPGP